MWGYWLFFAVESLLVHFVLPVEGLAMSDEAYIALIIFNSLALVSLLKIKYRHDGNFAILMIGGFLFRLFLMFWSEYFSHVFTLPNSGADEMTYYYNAMSALVKDKEFTGYALLFSWQARLFGLSKLYGKFVNVLLSVSAITILRRILIQLKLDSQVQTRTLTFACFLPNFAILSALLLRESIIIFLVAVSVYCLLQWWQEGKLGGLLIALVVSMGAAWLHSGMIAYTLGILCVAVSARRTPDGRRFELVSVRTMALSAVTATVVLLAVLNLNIGLSSYFRGADSLEDIVSIADAYEEGGSAYNANIVNNDSTAGFIINTPFRMFYFIFAPVPWNWRSATDAVAFVFSAVFYGCVFIQTMVCVLKTRNSSVVAVLFLIALLTLMMFGWGVSNSGTALRHRDKMVIHYLIMYAVIQNEKVPHRRR